MQRFSAILSFITQAALCLLCSLCFTSNAEEDPRPASQRYSITVFEDHHNFLNESPVYAISWRIVQAAIEQQELDVDVIPINWNSSINRLKKGKMDLVFGAYRTPQRSQWATFSLPLLPEESVVYALQDHPVNSLSDITDFTQYSVAAIEQSTQLGLATKLGFETIYAAAERKKLRDLLFSKRVDFIIAQASYPIPCRETICVKRYAALALQYYRVMGMDQPGTNHLLQRINLSLQQVVLAPEIIELLEQYKQPTAVAAWRNKLQQESRQAGKVQ